MKQKYLLVAGLLLIGLNNINAQLTKNIYVDKAGTMTSHFTEEEAHAITHLTLTGKINAIDFRYLRDDFKSLEFLDLSNVDIKSYMGKKGTYNEKFYVYPSNCIPAYAFCFPYKEPAIGKTSLREVVLSEKINNIEDMAFKGCDNLHICRINKKTPPNLLPDGLNENITAVFIPVGSRDAYRHKKRWEHFAFIENEPVKAVLEVGALGTLAEEIQRAGLVLKDINFLTIRGKLDEEDFKLISNYMSNLVALDIHNTTAIDIPDFTFAQKKQLLRISLPKDLKTIGQRVFSGCERLSGTLVLPQTLTSLGYGVFMGCYKLDQVIVQGNSLTSVGNELFGDSKGKLIYAKKETRW